MRDKTRQIKCKAEISGIVDLRLRELLNGPLCPQKGRTLLNKGE